LDMTSSQILCRSEFHTESLSAQQSMSMKIQMGKTKRKCVGKPRAEATSLERPRHTGCQEER
jgi:hypothetical protein